MPDPSPTLSPTPVEERDEQVKGIDFPRAYHALIKGFVHVHTKRKLKEIVQPKERQGEQR